MVMGLSLDLLERSVGLVRPQVTRYTKVESDMSGFLSDSESE